MITDPTSSTNTRLIGGSNCAYYGNYNTIAAGCNACIYYGCDNIFVAGCLNHSWNGSCQSYYNVVGAGFNANADYLVAFDAHINGNNSTLGGRYNGMLGGSDNDGGWGNYGLCGNFMYGGCINNVNGYSHVGITGGTYLGTYGNYQNCAQVITKTTGSFFMKHPDPSKCDTHELYHNFVESPTEGDNIYRYEVEMKNCAATLELPDYFKYLNKNPQVKVSPKNHFGRGFGIVDENLNCVTFTTNTDGIYNVFIIGTRKDDPAMASWKGVERLKYDSHPKVVGVVN